MYVHCYLIYEEKQKLHKIFKYTWLSFVSNPRHKHNYINYLSDFFKQVEYYWTITFDTNIAKIHRGHVDIHLHFIIIGIISIVFGVNLVAVEHRDERLTEKEFFE
jgi:hypothetical protein